MYVTEQNCHIVLESQQIHTPWRKLGCEFLAGGEGNKGMEKPLLEGMEKQRVIFTLCHLNDCSLIGHFIKLKYFKDIFIAMKN